MDENKKPAPVPSLMVESEADQKEWNIAKALHAQALKLKSIE
jgi:hypothetical protein